MELYTGDIRLDDLEYAEAMRDAVNYASANLISITEHSTVDCGFDYVVEEFFMYGCKPGGKRRRIGAIQDRPGSHLWRVHGRSKTYTLPEIIRAITDAIINGEAIL